MRLTVKAHVAPYGVVPGGGRGRLPQSKVHISLPLILIERIEELIRQDGSATSVPDFIRQAAVKEVERRLAGRQVPDERVPTTLRKVRSS